MESFVLETAGEAETDSDSLKRIGVLYRKFRVSRDFRWQASKLCAIPKASLHVTFTGKRLN